MPFRLPGSRCTIIAGLPVLLALLSACSPVASPGTTDGGRVALIIVDAQRATTQTCVEVSGVETTGQELIGLAGKHVNLYLSLSGIIGWFARAPYRGYHMIGEALQWAGPDKIVMGLDLPFDDMSRVVDYVRKLEMPEELQAKWGYPAITDEMRAKFLGLTLAKLAKIEPTKRVT